jgi:hypothetical protein
MFGVARVLLGVGRGCSCSCSCSCGCGCGRIWGIIFLWRLTWGLVWGPRLRGRFWGPRLRGSRRDGLLYGLLNCHGTRRTRGGLLPLLATPNEPEEESEERPHSNPHDIPPAAPPYVSPSSPHGRYPFIDCSNESRVALLRRTPLPRTRVNKTYDRSTSHVHKALPAAPNSINNTKKPSTNRSCRGSVVHSRVLVWRR